MLDEIINNLKATVPDAFASESPEIPWVRDDYGSEIIPFERIIESLTPTIFVDPSTEISEQDPELDGEIRERGTDALAWYVSFHQSRRWGIYFRVRGISYLANLLKTRSNRDDLNERIRNALDVLFYHEVFHFLTDMVSAHMEMVFRKPHYLPYKNRYSDFIEEALANAYVLRRVPKRYHSPIKRFFHQRPLRYREFSSYIQDTDFIMGKRKLGALLRRSSAAVIHPQVPSSLPRLDEPFWEFSFNVDPERVFLPEVPIYFVREKHPNGMWQLITPVTYGTKIAVYFSSEHGPPHIHIWIPPDNKKDGRYLYPSLEPYSGADKDRLSNQKMKKVKKAIEKYRGEIDDAIEKQRAKLMLA